MVDTEVPPCSNNKNLLDLNDDCLLEILQYLSLEEAFSLLGIFNSRFDEILYKRISQLKDLNFSLRDPPELSPKQLEILGRNLRTLNFSVGYSLDSELCISRYLGPICHYGSIRNLTLNYVHFGTDYQECVLKLALTLQILDLSFCQLTDNMLQPILEQCQQLESLKVIGNYDLKCEILHKSIKTEQMKEIILELNDQNDGEVHMFIANNPEICVKVFEKYRIHYKTYHRGQVYLAL